MQTEKKWRKINLTIFVLAFALFLIPSEIQASTAPDFGTAQKLTDGSLFSFPSVSGNILAYLDILDNSQLIGNVVIKNLETNKTITSSLPCFAPSVDGDLVVFSCMEGLYIVDTSTLDWDNPGSPTVFLTEAESLNSRAPQVWGHYVLVDDMNSGDDGTEMSYLLYDLDKPYSEGVNPIVLDTVTFEVMPKWGVFEDGVIAWYDGTSIKIYNLNDTTPQIQSFDVDADVVSLSVNQDYIAWSMDHDGSIDAIGYKSLSDLQADPVEIYEEEYLGPNFGPKLYGDHLIYMVTFVANKSADIIYYDLSSNQKYSAQQDIDFDLQVGDGFGVYYFLYFPPYAISDTTLYWGDLQSAHQSDIYSLSYASDQSDDSEDPEDTPDEDLEPEQSTEDNEESEPAQKAHIDSWKAYRYENTNGVSCPNKLKLTIKGKHFDKDAEVKIGNQEAYDVDRKNSHKIVAKFCMDDLLEVKTIHKRSVSVINPDAEREKADKKIHLDNLDYKYNETDFNTKTAWGTTNIQSALANLGYLEEIYITGFFGPITTDAITRFQADNGLPATGYFGPLTKNKLLEKI
jgi:hypothetical protein